MWKAWVWSLGWEDPLEKGKATHSSILVWRIPWNAESMGLQTAGHDWVTSVPINIHGWFPLGLTGLSPLLSKGLSRVFSSTTVRMHQLFGAQPFCGLIPFMTTGKTIALTIWTFVGEVVSLLFNILSQFGIAFLPRNKWLLILWLQSSCAVILEPNKMKYDSFHFFPI